MNRIIKDIVFILLAILISIIRSLEKNPAKNGNPDRERLAIVIVVTVKGKNLRRFPK